MEIIDLLIKGLPDIFSEKDISISSSNGEQRIHISNYKYCIDIIYNIVDNFYRIRFEQKSDEQIYFLAQSKRYHKEVKDRLKRNKLNKKIFSNHISAFIEIIKEYLDNESAWQFDRDLRFDGLFL